MKKHLITVFFALLAITFLVGEVEGVTSQLPGRKLKVSFCFPFFLDRFFFNFYSQVKKKYSSKTASNFFSNRSFAENEYVIVLD